MDILAGPVDKLLILVVKRGLIVNISQVKYSPLCSVWQSPRANRVVTH